MTDILKQIEKDFGGVVRNGNHLVDNPPTIISIGPSLDFALGGGITSGSLITLSGKPKLGKTTTALNIAKECQKEENKGRLCKEKRQIFYFNLESRLKKRDVLGVKDLDLDNFHIIGSSPLSESNGKILSGEEYLTIAEKIIHQVPGCVIIFDSFSFLITSADMSSEMESQSRATGAKLLYKFFRRISGIVATHDIIFISISHLISNPSPYGSIYKESGGNALQYSCDFKLQGKSMEPWIENEKTIGQKIEWLIGCSALGPPGVKCTSYLRFNHGLDFVRELCNTAADCGIIEKKGSWFTMSDGEKVQGEDKVYEILSSNLELYKEIDQQVKSMLL